MRGYLEAMRATFDFGGRASRGTFWSFTLVAFIIALLASIADAALHTGQTLNGIVGLIHAVPSLSVQVRRLHDRGRSGWWLLLTVTLVGIIPLLIWLCRRGEPGPNRFGGGGTALRNTVIAGELSSEASIQHRQPSAAAEPQPIPMSAVGRVLRGVLVVLGIGVGALLLAHANGFLSSSAPKCSAPEVTALVQKLMRENLEKGKLGMLIEPGKTRVDLQAIRTRSAEGRAVECAAHVSLGIALKPEFVAASFDDAMSMRSRSEVDVEYRAEVTDDHQHVYVTLRSTE